MPIPEISGHPILNCSCLQSNSDDLGISHDSVYVYYSVESSGHNEMTREEQHGQDQGDLWEEATHDSFLRRHGNDHHQQDQEQKVVPEGLKGQEASEETQRLLFV